MNLVQLTNANGKRQVAARIDGEFRHIKRTRSVLELAHAAIEAKTSIAEIVEKRGLGKTIDVAAAYAEGRLLPRSTRMILRIST